MSKPKCFIITELKSEDSPQRLRANWFYDHIYVPALSDYEIIRSDRIKKSGDRLNQIFRHIFMCDLVIIDYTVLLGDDGRHELNSNVIYEAALRHVTEKPYVQIKPKDIDLPFDIDKVGTITYENPKKLKQSKSARTRLIEEIGIYAQNTGHEEFIPREYIIDGILSNPKMREMLKERLVPYSALTTPDYPHLQSLLDKCPHGDVSLFSRPNLILPREDDLTISSSNILSAPLWKPSEPSLDFDKLNLVEFDGKIFAYPADNKDGLDKH